MIKKITLNLLAFALAVTTIFTYQVSTQSEPVKADETVHTISNFTELVYWAKKCSEDKNKGAYCKDTYQLTADITITDDNIKALTDTYGKGSDYITFGSSDYPFTGTFDGQGYTIKGLKYAGYSMLPRTDTGLFTYCKGATVQNLNIDSANIYADYRGAIVCGKAENSRFINITVTDSHLNVACADNVLTLITDGGIRGGTIVGDSSYSKYYNCEANKCFVNTNNTAAIQALGGKVIALGALVGTSDSDYIEYSRAIGGKVKAYYDVAVSALGGNTIYVGGIVSRIKENTSVVDCFSTANLTFYTATYVGVGAGNSGYIGGICAQVREKTAYFKRCHYAGRAGGDETADKQYNVLIVIPIIQENVNIGGIVGKWSDYDRSDRKMIDSCYYMPSKSPDVTMYTVNGLNPIFGSEKGPLNDVTYRSREYWQRQGYDFAGTINRNDPSSAMGNPHYNKWVMDYNLGIPVHGESVAATFDFENAGSVTVSATNLVEGSVTTDDPYSFAVQGYKVNEKKMTITATAISNRYRIAEWYRRPGVTAESVSRNYSYFEKIFSNESYNITQHVKDTIEIEQSDGTKTVQANLKSQTSILTESQTGYQNAKLQNFNDNDLYIARFQASVKFYDINGNKIDRSDGSVVVDNAGNPVDTVLENDWYFYNATIPNVVPVNGSSYADAKLIGWTTVPGKYEAIENVVLFNLIANGQFYTEGDQITKPMDLYPVYQTSLKNIITICEGHDNDSSSDYTLRTDYAGTTAFYTDESDPTSTSVTIKAYPNGSSRYTDVAEYSWTDGYRFLGWYEIPAEAVEIDGQLDESKLNSVDIIDLGYRLTRDPEYVLTDVDLSENHYYLARFEYRQDYYVTFNKYDGASGIVFSRDEPYYSRWQVYHSTFYQLPSPLEEGSSKVNTWYYGKPRSWDDSTSLIADCKCSSNWAVNNDSLGGTYYVTSPYSFHNHLTGSDEKFVVMSDFPGSGWTSLNEKSSAMNFSISPNTGESITGSTIGLYNFLFWQMDGNSNYGRSENYGTFNTDGSISGSNSNIGKNKRGIIIAHMTANLTFKNKDESENKTVSRRYYESILLNGENEARSQYLISNGASAETESMWSDKTLYTNYYYPFSSGQYHYYKERIYSIGEGKVDWGQIRSKHGFTQTDTNDLLTGTSSIGLYDPKYSVSEPTKDEMYIPGYYFIGWVDMNEGKYSLQINNNKYTQVINQDGDIQHGEVARAWEDWIADNSNPTGFDTADVTYINPSTGAAQQGVATGDSNGNETCTTTSISHVYPYIIQDETEDLYYDQSKCTSYMDVYPVYAKIDLWATSNIAEDSENGTLPAGYNVPDVKLTARIAEGATPLTTTVNVELTVETNPSIYSSARSAAAYTLDYVVRIDEDGTETKLDGNNGVYTDTVVPGPKYIYKAVYSYVTVTYHINQTTTATGEEAGSSNVFVTTENGTNYYTYVEVKTYGDVLGDEDGNLQDPTFDLTVLNTEDNYSPYCVDFVGWTESVPGSSGYFIQDEVTGENMDLVFVSAISTLVLEDMNLYPVYKKVNFTVDSNIDSKISSSHENLRTYETVGPDENTDTRYFRIKAKDTITEDGVTYSFVGWKYYEAATGSLANADYLALSDNCLVHEAEDDGLDPGYYYYKLDEGLIYSGYVFTACYVESVKLTYHNTNNDEIYVTYAETGRSMVKEYTYEAWDECHLNADGTYGGQVEKTETLPIDSEAFVLIQDNLVQPTDKTKYQVFYSWIGIDSDGKKYTWEQMKSDDFRITKSMDLYPVVLELQAYNPVAKRALTCQPSKDGQEVTDSKVLFGTASDSVVMFMMEDYYYQYVDVSVNKVTYKAGSVDSRAAVKDQAVDLYLYPVVYEVSDESNTGSSGTADEDKDVSAVAGYFELYGTEKTNNTVGKNNQEDTARFELLTTLKVNKLMEGNTDNDDYYLISLLDINSNEILQFSLEAVKKLKDGAVTITLPFGKYQILEDGDWSWRYSASYELYNMTDAIREEVETKDVEITIGDETYTEQVDVITPVEYTKFISAGKLNTSSDNQYFGLSDLHCKQVTISNTKVTSTWLSDSDRNVNVFGTVEEQTADDTTAGGCQ